MNFNSQICTTREQSERLMALGLKKETADMSISTQSFDTDNGVKYSLIPYSECKYRIMYNIIPAWSLNRLLSMLPEYIDELEAELAVNQSSCGYTNDDKWVYFTEESDNTYDNIITCIEWLIGLDKFNKNYLNYAE